MSVRNPLSLARAQALFAAIAGVVGDFSARIFKADQPGFFRRDHIGFENFNNGGIVSVDSNGPKLQANGVNKYITLYDGLFHPSQNPIFEAVVKASTVTDVSYEVGFGDKDYNDIAAFYFDTGSYAGPNWHVIWDAWGVDNELTAGNSLDGQAHPPNTSAFEKLRVEIVSGTSIMFYIDDVLVFSSTRDIPSSPLPAQVNIFTYALGFKTLSFREVLARQNAFS